MHNRYACLILLLLLFRNDDGDDHSERNGACNEFAMRRGRGIEYGNFR